VVDSHLSALSDDARLGAPARKRLTARGAQACFSLGSIWEIAIKSSLGAAIRSTACWWRKASPSRCCC